MATSRWFDPAFNNTGTRTLKVPGCGLPLNYFGIDVENPTDRYKGWYRYGTEDFAPERMTVREVAMLQFMNAITDKPNWEDKIMNEDIVSKWRTEALQHPDMSDKAFDWLLRELKEKVDFYVKHQFITILDNASLCVKSDKLISRDVQQDLKRLLQPLFDTTEPDWHPNSNDQVRNLVHPSLYPLVYDRTQVLTTGLVGLEDCTDSIGKGEVISLPDDPWATEEQGGRVTSYSGYKNFYSLRFQWLPCEVKFREDTGTDVHITSYINNLHPVKYQPLYGVIEKLIGASIEPWSQTLIYGRNGRYPVRIKTFGAELFDDESPDFDIEDYSAVVPEETRSKIREFLNLPDGPYYEPGMRDDEDIPDNWEELSGDEVMEAVQAKVSRRRWWNTPDAGEGSTYEEWREGNIKPVVKGYSGYDTKHEFNLEDLARDFRDRGLQVIVKIAGIELTPENPSYGGGSWHLEGMVNEHIVSTSIYYYDVENVTDSQIRFRQRAELDEVSLDYEQEVHAPLEAIWGTAMRDETAVQEIGSLSTFDGQFIAFPNILQHCVQPFELADKTKPGHRRFVVLWLVDPHLRVCSTANVPPQQHEWWAEEVEKKTDMNLPPEVRDMIMSHTTDWPMGLAEAKQLRLDLMSERTDFDYRVFSAMESYNLCEH